MTELALSFLAGLLTVLSPCVLPALPFIVNAAFSEHRLGPLGLGLGLFFSFTIVGFLLASVGAVFGLDTETIRSIAAILILVSGLVLIFKPIQDLFERNFTPIANRINQYAANKLPSGMGGQFILGALLGIIWSPCTGPTLGAAIGLASQEDTQLQALAIMSVFSLGTSIPVIALSFGSKTFVTKKQSILKGAGTLKKIMGGLFVLVGVGILLAWDKALETAILGMMPEWLLDLITKY